MAMRNGNVVDFPKPQPEPPFRTMSEAFEWSEEQTKLKMIWHVAHMETINSISKDTLRKMLRYLADLTMEEY